jgi:MFS family permease
MAAILFAAFWLIEQHVKQPLVPLGLFRLRNLAISNAIAVLWAAAMFAWFFISALYMQQVLAYQAFEVGLAFLPANLIMAVLSLSLSAKLVMRYGLKLPLLVGLATGAIGLALFSRMPVHGDFTLDILPGMILLGLGAGIAFNPMLMAAMQDVDQADSGLASGLINTSFMMGGAIGLAILASVAAMRTEYLTMSNTTAVTALNGGYQLAFAIGALFALLAAWLSVFLIEKSHANF